MTNVLIYIADALRADHLSCYGYGRSTSPNIDALAAEAGAVRFARAYSPSTWTKPVAASILSGCYPPAHGVRSRSDVFIRSVPRLPEILQEAGYQTAAVSTIGNVSSVLGFGIGFDHFVDLYKDPHLVGRRQVSNAGAWKLYLEEDVAVVLPLAEDVNEHGLAWLRQAAARGPWFLLLWALDPHDPYYPPAGYDRWRDPTYTGRIDGSAESVRRVRTAADVRRLVDLYDGEIAYTDAQFGQLMAALKDLGAYHDTLIVVAGDHGEAFGEHGDFVHGHLAYDEVMSVPLIIKFPTGMESGGDESLVAHGLAQLTDIAPTVLNALGMARQAEGMQGCSLLPALNGGRPRTMAYAETQASAANNRLLAVRSERWKYLRVDPPASWGAGDGSTADSPVTWRRRLAGYWGHLSNPDMLRKVLRNPMFYVRRQMAEREMLFDLEADAGEQHNMISARPEVAADMRAALNAWLAECRLYASLSDHQGAGIGLDEATRRQLEGLGYL